MIRKIKTR